MKNQRYLYYVEGQDDKCIIDVLKTEFRSIYAGKVQVLNVVTSKITKSHLMNISPSTIVILVYDTDVAQTGIFCENIKTLEQCQNVKAIYYIPQVKKLEHELERACNITNITELLNSKSSSNFKRDLLNCTNIKAKLEQKGFDIHKMWTQTPTKPFDKWGNDSYKIKY